MAGEPLYDIEHRIIVDGKIKWVHQKAHLEFDKNGALLGGFGITQDITESKNTEETLRQSEQRIRLKLNTVLSPAGEITNLKLSEIVDAQAIQSLMNDFYKLAHIPMSLDDLRGNILVGVGWQDICTGFHRINPEACKHCVESDTKLSAGVPPGEFKLYKCKNNMWEIATPIIVGNNHVGNVFSGQFFFEDESLDYELFQSQARKYGFDEKEYIEALEKVPRLSREIVNIGMSFFMKLSNMISQLSYSNLKLAQSLVERDSLVEALEESEKRYRMLFDHSTDAIILSDPRDGGKIISANPAAYRMLGWAEDELIGKGRSVMFDPEDPEVSDLLEELLRSGSAKAQLTYRRRDRTTFPGEMSTALFTDSNGEPRAVIVIRDITERKRAEETLAFERSQLLSIFDGMDDVVYVTDPYTYEVLYANKAMKEKFGGELVGGICYREFQRRDSPCDFCTNPIILKERDKPYHWEYYNPMVDRYFMIMDRIIRWPDGRDVRFEIAKDITERKRAEEALQKAHCHLEVKVKERTAELEKAYNSLKESEKGLSDAQKMAHIGNWEWDIGTDRAYWSDELYRIFGRNPEELAPAYNEFLNYAHPQARDYMDNAHKRALNGKPYNLEYRIVRKDGEERIIHMQSEVIFNEKNTPIRLKGIVQDITERKRVEEMLKESESKLRTLFELLPVGVSIINKEGNILDANLALENILGLSRSDLLSGKYRAQRYIRYTLSPRGDHCPKR